jgi:hypothetical protein
VGRRNFVRLRLAAPIVFVGAMTALAPAANAAVTVGQTGDPAGSACGGGVDWLQRTVSSGNSYVVPNTGGVTSWKVTSWSSFGSGSDIQMKLKFFRSTPTPDRYQAVAQTGPETVHAGGLAGNTFQADLTVRAGDILGQHTVTMGDCLVPTTSDEDFFGSLAGDLADGQADNFGTSGSKHYRLDMEAQLTPVNTFSVGKTQLNRKKGTATLSFNLPNPGQLTGSGKGAKVASEGAHASKTVQAGAATLHVKAKGKKAKQLAETGKAKLSVKVTFTPTGGDASTSTIKMKLRKR